MKAINKVQKQGMTLLSDKKKGNCQHSNHKYCFRFVVRLSLKARKIEKKGYHYY